MEFNELYQEIIMDHYRNPRHAKDLSEANVAIHENPTCGDSVKVQISINEQHIIDKVFFDNKGCAISTASASIMSDFLCGLQIQEALEKIKTFIAIMKGEENPDILDTWDDLVSFKSVMHFPARIKCATLAWHAIEDEITSQVV